MFRKEGLILYDDPLDERSRIRCDVPARGGCLRYGSAFPACGDFRSVQNDIIEGASQARVRAPDGLAFSAPDRVSSRHQVLADKYARYRRKTL